MNQSKLPRVPVAVALVTNENQEILWVFNDKWGEFALPMKRFFPGQDGIDESPAAALRAAAEALGVPVRLVENRSTQHAFEAFSQRQLTTKYYAYNLFRVEPHPDFAGRLAIRQPHLWLTPHLALSGEYEPLSRSSRGIVFHTLEDFGLPARLQHTSVLIVRRQSPERGIQFLLRWNPDWGYALPAKRRDAMNPALSGAERVAREELGLEPGKDVILAAAQVVEVKTHGVSRTEGPPAYGAFTDYVHALFDAEILHQDHLHSAEPLVWATVDEIHLGSTAATDPAGRTPPGRAGKISLTVADLLETLEYIEEHLSPEAKKDIDEWTTKLLRRQQMKDEET